MAIEIELKAHVQDSEALKKLLYKKAEYKRSFIKEDAYWLPVSTPACDFGQPPIRVRVRREKQHLSDETEESVTFVTYKTKKVIDGIEVNDEREFEIRSSASTSGAEFEELLTRIGFERGFTKQKQGWLFTKDDISAELCEVQGLGWFIELEILSDNNREDTVSLEKKRLMEFLSALGIGSEALESRYYSEMLTG